MLTVLVCLRRQITAGYYMKILHLFSKSTLNLSESGLPLKCLLKYFFFFKSLLTISCKSIFYVSAVNYYCTYIFKGSNYRFFSLLFKTYFKNSCFDPGFSNYLWIEFLEFFLYQFYIFNLCNFIFKRLICEMISVYLLWFHFWTLKEWKLQR